MQPILERIARTKYGYNPNTRNIVKSVQTVYLKFMQGIGEAP